MTGAVAAIAEPPQIDEPMPINVHSFVGMFMYLQITKEIISEVAMVGLLRIFDEVDEHLGVGVAIEMEPTLLQLVAKQGEVLDDAIVNDDKIA